MGSASSCVRNSEPPRQQKELPVLWTFIHFEVPVKRGYEALPELPEDSVFRLRLPDAIKTMKLNVKKLQFGVVIE